VAFALLTLFPGRVGGSETNARGLLREFASGNGPEEVTVLANKLVELAYGEYEGGPIRLHRVRTYRSGDSTSTRAFAMVFARAFPRAVSRDVPRDPEVFHYPLTVPIPATDRPRVVSLYDIQHHDLPGFFSRAERRYRRWAYDGAARSAALVVTSSAFTKTRVVDLIGVAPERIEVVHLGLDRERFRPTGEDDERLLQGLEVPARFLLYPANFWPHKNHRRLFEALALIQDREMALVLTGQDYGKSRALRAQAGSVADRVSHLGHVPAEALPALYRAAEALVFPSLYEGFGSPALEAMACGCAVAASDRTSLPEICGDGALLFDAGSAEAIAAAIDRLLSDRGLRNRLQSSGMQRTAQFTWESAAARHRAIYERAAATSG